MLKAFESVFEVTVGHRKRLNAIQRSAFCKDLLGNVLLFHDVCMLNMKQPPAAAWHNVVQGWETGELVFFHG